MLAWTLRSSCWLLLVLFAETAVAADAPTVIRTARDGRWSDPQTWEGNQVPGKHARVLIRTIHTVTYDVSSDDVIRAINIGGTLNFATDRSTRLNVGLIKIEALDSYTEEGFDCDAHLEIGDASVARATLAIGSADQPLAAEHTATIRLHYVEGMDKQSCPAIVCCAGRWDLHGAPLSRTWVKLGATAKAKESAVTLQEPVTGWRVGDRILITATHSERGTDGTRRPSKRTEEVYTEERTIQALAGNKITLDQPLEHEHLGAGELRGEVANLSRNIVIETADSSSERGHTMYHRGSAGSISHAEFRHLGKEGVLGRYALHYHMIGNTMRGSSIVGASIWDSHNRWLTIHGTNYLVVRDNVGYQSIGHGFFMEDGTEVYNVLDRNLAVQAYEGRRLPKQVLPFDQNEGAGYWWSNSLNTFTRNVACENDRYGFRFEATPSSSFNITTLPVMQPDGSEQKTDVRKLPFVRFEGNEAHCDGKYGINLGEGVRLVGPDTKHPFVMRDTKVWEVHYAMRLQSPSLLVENLHIESCDYGIYHPNYDHYVFRNVKILNADAEPFNRGHDDDSIQHGPLTVDGIEFTAKYFQGNMPFIQMSDNNPSGNAVSHFRKVTVLNRPDKGRKPLVNRGGGTRAAPKTEQGVPVFIHDYYGPGRHAKVVSSEAKDLLADGNVYRVEAPLTGDASQVTEVSDAVFPELLPIVDDLPPQTIITRVTRLPADKLRITGVVADNGAIKSVTVNGSVAVLDAKNGQWQIEIARPTGERAKITAHAEDAAGNVERLAHEIAWK
ncbi:MAG TPA: G8 domain-containing protein [Pirellulaceae bacterium]|nr:G8 domain-containing protein [Pirellulaceae bacterium]